MRSAGSWSWALRYLIHGNGDIQVLQSAWAALNPRDINSPALERSCLLNSSVFRRKFGIAASF